MFARLVTDIFVESFVVIGKSIYNKTIINTLNCIGTLNDLGVCVIRHLVKQIVILFDDILDGEIDN